MQIVQRRSDDSQHSNLQTYFNALYPDVTPSNIVYGISRFYSSFNFIKYMEYLKDTYDIEIDENKSIKYPDKNIVTIDTYIHIKDKKLILYMSLGNGMVLSNLATYLFNNIDSDDDADEDDCEEDCNVYFKMSYDANTFTSKDVEEFIKNINRFASNPKAVNNKKKLNILIRGYDGFDAEEHNIVSKIDDITKYYNDNVLSENDKITKFLKSEDSGLVLLHGEKGTGKTSYIRHLINSVDKKFIYVPESFFTNFTDPGFMSYLSTLKDSVIILEDCEDLLCKRDSGRTSLIADILNFSDGLLSDVFQLKFICTFNCDLNKLDDAITRKGRLISNIEFDKLKVDKANALLKELNIENDNKKDLPLCDIFNYEELKKELAAKPDKDKRRIGF